jgi:hypothetical protein
MGQTADELKTDIDRRRENLAGTVDAIEDRVLPGRIIERRRQAVRRWTGATKEKVMGVRDDITDRSTAQVGGAVDQAKHMGEQIADAPAQLADQTRGAPLIAGGIAFGLGALVALMLPETRVEQRVADSVQPQIDAATDAAKDVGRQALHTAQESATDAVSELKESASDHASSVAQQAKDAGDEVKDTAKEASGRGS